MKFNTGTSAAVTLLTLLISSGAHAAVERPQLKNYSSYTDFLRAVVEYTTRESDTPSAAEQQCRDNEASSDGQSSSKQDLCLSKTTRKDDILSAGETQDGLMPDDMDSDPSADASLYNNATGDSLEQAIALTRDGLNPVYQDPDNARTTFRSFPMQPIDSSALADIAQIDVLTGLLVSTRANTIRLDIDPSQLTDPMAVVDSRLVSDGISLNLASITPDQLILDNIAGFETNNIVWATEGNYYTYVSASPSYTSDGGIRLEFSSSARVRMAMVDRDGRPTSNSASIPYAGALVVDPLSITTSNVVTALHAVDDSNGNTAILATLDVGDGIDIDLSNTKLGVASATRNSSGDWNLGRVSNFLYFGSDSHVSINMNEPMEILLSNPEDTSTDPLVTINGSINNLSLSNVSLMDNNSGGGIHFGRFSISEMAMVNTRIYINDEVIRLDLSDSLANLHMTIENIVLGGPLNDPASRPPAIGDAEVRVTRIDNLQLSMQPH